MHFCIDTKNYYIFSSICHVSNTPEHSCFQAPVNLQVSSQENTDYWVKYNRNKSINQINTSSGLLTHFNPCANLPVIAVLCQGKTVWAIIDTGACKSVITDKAASSIFGKSFKTRLTTANQCQLTDVNNRQLSILGTIKLLIIIKSYQFDHPFIVYKGSASELIIGYDFLTKFKLDIQINVGLFFTAQKHTINHIASQQQYKVYTVDSFTLVGKSQKMIQVRLENIQNDITNLIKDSYLLVSSETLEPHQKFTDLLVMHQYIHFDALLVRVF